MDNKFHYRCIDYLLIHFPEVSYASFTTYYIITDKLFHIPIKK